MAYLRANKLFRILLVGCVIVVITLTYVMSNNDDRIPVLPPIMSHRGETNHVLEVDVEDVFMSGNSSLTSGVEVTQQPPDLFLKASDRSGVKGSRSEVEMRIPVGGAVWRNLKSLMRKAEYGAFPWLPVKEKMVNCAQMFAGNQEEINRANTLASTMPLVPDSDVTNRASQCATFRQSQGFIMSPLTKEEEEFPIAFSILTFKDADQVLNLLRAIYRPQNYYCIHVDNKSKADFREAITAVASCFPNVFLASRSVDVRWGEFSVLEPEIVCMEDLWTRKKWKYFINLTGQEFPLKTNFELVRILKAFNGANSVEGTRKRSNQDRWQQAGKTPANILPTKGSVHITVNRDFVDFVLHTRTGQDFLGWARGVGIPDEAFFSSLNHNPHLGIRGTYKGEPETDGDSYPFITRFKNWGGYPFNYPCAGGKRVRLICILSVGDLPLLDTRRELFANKFYPDYSRFALNCLAERNYNHTRDEFLGNMGFDVSYYENLSFVKNQVMTSTFNRTL